MATQTGAGGRGNAISKSADVGYKPKRVIDIAGTRLN